MELVAKKTIKGSLLPALLLVALASPVCAQEQVVEYGRIVQADDGTGSINYLVGEEVYYVEEDKKAWIPILSPLMIRLDCWMTKVVNIHQFYSQQAADEYWAYAETCSEIPLSMDPNIFSNTGLKYTVLSPIYAWCPGMLNRQGILGGCGGYGIPSPCPSVASINYPAYGTGATVTGSPAYTSTPANVPPSDMGLQPMPQGGVQMNAPSMPAVPEAPPVGGMSQTAPPRSNMASGGKWSSMSDAEILAHFGLDPSMAARAKQSAALDGSKLEEPVVDSEAWQFAEEAPTVTLDRKEMVALSHDSYPPSVEPLELPEPVVVKERVISRSKPSESMVKQQPEIELEFEGEESPVEANREFSSTDSEYDRMRDIEKELLGF